MTVRRFNLYRRIWVLLELIKTIIKPNPDYLNRMISYLYFQNPFEMKANRLLPVVIFLSLLLACESEKKVNKDVIDEINKLSEVKKVNEADMISYAMKWGDEISNEAQQALISTLQKAIAEQGIGGAVEFCRAEALPITHEVGKKHKVTVKRVSLKNRNPSNSPSDVEKNLLEAYAYNVENNLENKPNIQKIDEGETLLFTKAIVIPNGMCLNCHGEAGKEIAEETLTKIQTLYPEDQATGFKVGDLRGMWSIALPKSEVIKNM